VVCIYNRVLFSLEKEWSYHMFRNVDGTRAHHVKLNNPVSRRQASHIFSYMWNLGVKEKGHENKRQLFGIWKGEQERVIEGRV
jgi:hypothetical protein